MVKKFLLSLLLAATLLSVPMAHAYIAPRDEAGINNAESYLDKIRPDNAPQSPLGFDTETLREQEDVVPLGRTIISTLTGFLAAIAGTYAVFMLLRHSFGLITSDGDTKKAEDARKGMLWSILGLLGIIFSYLIIFTIVDTLFRVGTPGQGF